MTVSQRRFQLRENTAAAHASLDEMVGHFECAVDYRRYLAGMAVFRLSVEPMLAKVDAVGNLNGWIPSLIASEINQDMTDLGMSISVSRSGPPVEDREELLGIGYVLEGSALGAKLLRQRAAAIGFTENFGARHLAAQTESPDSWRAYLAALDAQPDLDMDNVCRSANQIFAIAQQSFGTHADAA